MVFSGLMSKLKVFFQTIVPEEDAVPGAVITIQTFGDFLNFNPHCHVLCTDGVFYESGSFKVAPALHTKPLEKIFQHKVLGMLLRKGKIREEVGKLIMSWRHSGFNVHCGPRIQPGDEETLENIARYIIRASFSQERMTYIPEESKERPPPRMAKAQPLYTEPNIDYSDSQVIPSDNGFYVDPTYPADFSV